MKTYIWAYEAKTCHGAGSFKGRVEATNGLSAMNAVKENNLMIESVSVKLLKNQKSARNEKFETYTGFKA